MSTGGWGMTLEAFSIRSLFMRRRGGECAIPEASFPPWADGKGIMFGAVMRHVFGGSAARPAHGAGKRVWREPVDLAEFLLLARGDFSVIFGKSGGAIQAKGPVKGCFSKFQSMMMFTVR